MSVYQQDPNSHKSPRDKRDDLVQSWKRQYEEHERAREEREKERNLEEERDEFWPRPTPLFLLILILGGLASWFLLIVMASAIAWKISEMITG